MAEGESPFKMLVTSLLNYMEGDEVVLVMDTYLILKYFARGTRKMCEQHGLIRNARYGNKFDLTVRLYH